MLARDGNAHANLNLGLLWQKLHSTSLGFFYWHIGLKIMSYEVVGKNLSLISHILYECDALATLGCFCLGSEKLDTEFNRKTHPRSILAFS